MHPIAQVGVVHAKAANRGHHHQASLAFGLGHIVLVFVVLLHCASQVEEIHNG
jgi:hypothetical protein